MVSNPTLWWPIKEGKKGARLAFIASNRSIVSRVREYQADLRVFGRANTSELTRVLCRTKGPS
jgi:hypothetical protein